MQERRTNTTTDNSRNSDDGRSNFDTRTPQPSTPRSTATSAALTTNANSSSASQIAQPGS
eukprot:7972240-Alexandrium_andersonii.AAC.1